MADDKQINKNKRKKKLVSSPIRVKTDKNSEDNMNVFDILNIKANSFKYVIQQFH